MIMDFIIRAVAISSNGEYHAKKKTNRDGKYFVVEQLGKTNNYVRNRYKYIFRPSRVFTAF